MDLKKSLEKLGSGSKFSVKISGNNGDVSFETDEKTVDIFIDFLSDLNFSPVRDIIKSDNFISKGTVFILPKTVEEISEVLNKISPINSNFVVNNHRNKVHVDSPYNISIQNGLKEINIVISYDYENDVEIRISFNFDIIKDLFTNEEFKRGVRNVNDTEHSYFGGVCLGDIERMSIPTVTFNIDNVLRWYGSNETLVDINMIDRIIGILKTGNVKS